jgi:proteasome lid subunit RPN8/RPN11
MTARTERDPVGSSTESMQTTQEIIDEIRAHGRETYPEECCGFLLGSVEDGENHVEAVRRVDNRRADMRERRYQIRPQDFLEADREARRRGLDIVGIYHSHPDHPASPSITDLAEATFPGYTYVIVSIMGGLPDALTAWLLATDRSRFEPEPVLVVKEQYSGPKPLPISQ